MVEFALTVVASSLLITAGTAILLILFVIVVNYRHNGEMANLYHGKGKTTPNPNPYRGIEGED